MLIIIYIIQRPNLRAVIQLKRRRYFVTPFFPYTFTRVVQSKVSSECCHTVVVIVVDVTVLFKNCNYVIIQCVDCLYSKCFCFDVILEEENIKIEPFTVLREKMFATSPDETVRVIIHDLKKVLNYTHWPNFSLQAVY